MTRTNDRCLLDNHSKSNLIEVVNQLWCNGKKTSYYLKDSSCEDSIKIISLRLKISLSRSVSFQALKIISITEKEFLNTPQRFFKKLEDLFNTINQLTSISDTLEIDKIESQVELIKNAILKTETNLEKYKEILNESLKNDSKRSNKKIIKAIFLIEKLQNLAFVLKNNIQNP